MMSVLSDALAMLEAMKGAEWSSQVEVYSTALDGLPERLVLPAVMRFAGETWRPAAFDIVREAVRIEMASRAGTACAYPSADEAYAEITHKVRRFGLNGHTPNPERPNLTVAGAPPFSHPLVARTVALVGGWEGLCTGEANFAEGLAKQIKSVYERQAALWTERAALALRRPDSEASAYFPCWRPWELRCDWQPPRPQGQAAIAPPRREEVPCPPEIRARLAAMGVGLV